MRHLLSIGLPVAATISLTVFSVLIVRWLTGLVPEGEWAGLARAGIILFVVWCAVLSIAWSAYFAYVIRKSFEA